MKYVLWKAPSAVQTLSFDKNSDSFWGTAAM